MPLHHGVFIPAVLRWALSHPWFQTPPPRTGGHEHFGKEFVNGFVERCGRECGSTGEGDHLKQQHSVPEQQQKQQQHFVLVNAEQQQLVVVQQHSAAYVNAGATQLTRNMIRTALELTAVSIVASIRLHVGPIKLAGSGSVGGRLIGGRRAGGRVMLSGGGTRNPTLVARLRTLAPELTWLTTEEAGVHPDAKEAMGLAVLGYLTLAGSCGDTLATGAQELSVLGKICHPGVGKGIPSFPKL